MKDYVEGYVIEVSEDIAKVRLSRHGDCSYCGSCHGDNAVILKAYNYIGAKSGQKVTVEMQKDAVLKAAFIVYVLPMLAIFTGVVIAEFLSTVIKISRVTLDIFWGCVFFLISIIVITRYDKAVHQKERLPIVDSIID